MALRLRRGTDAERLLITPVEGELIYTTDTKSVYVGDGTTVGGVLISGEIDLGDLDDVDLSTPPTQGQVLEFDGTKFVPRFISGVVEGSDYRINVISADSTTIVDSDTGTFNGTFNGTFVGDGSGLTNLPISVDGSGIVEGSNYRINIVADDSTTLVDTRNNTISGTFIGDGSEVTNINFSNINGVFLAGDIAPNDVLIYDGDNFRAGRVEVLYGDDSAVAFDASTTTFTGTFVGDGSALSGITLDSGINGLNDVFIPETPAIGDVLIFDGSNFRAGRVEFLYGDDSAVAFDASTTTFTGTFVGDGSGLTGVNQNLSINDLTDVYTPVVPAIGDFLSWDGSNWSSGRIDFLLGDDSTVLFDAASEQFTGNFTGDLTGNVVGNVVGNVTGNVTGNAFGNHTGTFAGTITATGTLDGDVSGSIFSDSSQLLVDGINGRVVCTVDNESIITEDLLINKTTSPRSRLKLISTGDLSAYSGLVAEIGFETEGSNGNISYGRIQTWTSGIIIAANDTGSFPAETLNVFSGDGVSIGGINPTARLDVRGAIKPGVYADATARDTDITSPVEGMMVFLQDTQKMQVYVSDTGLAAGGPSNATADWYDMY